MASSVNMSLKAGGEDLSRDLRLIALDCRYECHGIPEARITLGEAKTSKAQFSTIERPELAPGSTVEVNINNMSDKAGEVTAFKGIITGVEFKVTRQGARLELICHSELIRLVEPRLTRRFKEASTDKQIVTELFKDASIPTGNIGDMNIAHDQMMVFDENAWSFIKYRTEANGFMLVPKVDGVFIQPVSKFLEGEAQELKLDKLMNVELSLDATSTLRGLGSSSWDIKTQKLLKAEPGEVPKVSGGPETAQKVAKALGRNQGWQPISDHIMAAEGLKGWSTGEKLYRELDRYQGLITLPGTGKVEPGSKVKLVDLSKQFKDEYLVTGVRQRVTREGWQTTLRIGLPITRTSFFKGLHKQNNTMRGLLVGKVVGYEKKQDPDFYRVQVKLPILGEKDNLIWARLATPYATKEAGFFFPPEPEDEVVLGWFGNSATEPVILGSMHNPVHLIPQEYAKEMQRGLVMVKDKLTWLFDPKKVEHNLLVGEERSLAMSGETGLTITQKEHSLVLGEAVECTSGADMTLVAKGALTLKPDGNAVIEAGGECEIKASQVKIP